MTNQALIDIIAPAAGESVTEGVLLDWLVTTGDKVEAGQTLVEFSTDKVDIELPAPSAGVIVEILAEPGQTIQVGQLLARMDSSAPPPAAPASESAQPKAPAEEQLPITPPAPQVKISPLAARVAAVNDVDVSAVDGSGIGGRIMKADVADLEPAGSANALEIKGGNAMLVRYMQDSLLIPTATSFRTITVSQMTQQRQALKEAGHKVSFTHIIAWAVVQVAQHNIPEMAHHFLWQENKPFRVDDGGVNLGIAVDVEKKDGTRNLMVPVIMKAGEMEFNEFLAAFNELVDKARNNKLGADDLVGANMTLTNPGGIGTVASVPRLMEGQGTIVAAGSIGLPVGAPEQAEELGFEKIMTLTSTYDHRIIQGAQSGRFLQQVEALLSGESEFYQQIFRSLQVTELAVTPASNIDSPPARVPSPVDGTGGPGSAQATGRTLDEELLKAMHAATLLIRAYRTHGHLAASLDPLGREPLGDPALSPENFHLSESLLPQLPAVLLNKHVEEGTAADVLKHMKEAYTGNIAYELEHITNHEQREWMRASIESKTYGATLNDDARRTLLRRLIDVDSLERFMHKTFLGQKQFSIEGIDMTVPMLDCMVRAAGGAGAKEVSIGMAHRGRLNVLAHTLERPYETLFGEFEGGKTLEAVQVITTMPQDGTGDVKYHHGFETEREIGLGLDIKVQLEANPSHLEFVNPVVLGAARAEQTDRSGRGDNNPRFSMPILLHGDAAFPGQGVVAETLNLQALEGYQVGGAVHLIQNNQVGFTTDSADSRSTYWASDLAKGFDVPIIHVNADDPEACIAACQMAVAFRNKFGHDVLIDLIGYRRFGHNEGDEPSYTQPEMYELIKAHKRVWEIYAEQLSQAGVVEDKEVEEWQQDSWRALDESYQQLKARVNEVNDADVDVSHFGEHDLSYPASDAAQTALTSEGLRELNKQLMSFPADFTVHRKLLPQLERRQSNLEEGRIDWAQAEGLALASLLNDGVPIRLTGQDTRRGTFSHRHLTFHDADTGSPYAPIQNLPNAQASMELYNSPLSEVACLGFEYGYAHHAPEALVLWEAQFGDFANGAQVIIDQFIASGLAKWDQSSRLTLLLPHGYEGAGPEHSSARLERFLQLCAEGNMRIANPTTPAQYFHLLRRQAMVTQQRPLIIMTPKSLLRLPASVSSLNELSQGIFMPLIVDRQADVEKITRLILCSGKIFYDLDGHELRAANPQVAIARIEQLYPFPEDEIKAMIDLYPNLEEIAWTQEEPRNMGARSFMVPRLSQILPEGFDLGYVGRPERASTSEGYPAAHNAEQQRIIEVALNPTLEVTLFPTKTPGER